LSLRNEGGGYSKGGAYTFMTSEKKSRPPPFTERKYVEGERKNQVTFFLVKRGQLLATPKGKEARPEDSSFSSVEKEEKT